MYGIGYISRSLVDTLQAGNGLGKPTIKFEFEDNQALADFLTKTKENVDYAETVDADSNPLNVNNRRQSRKAAQQKALTDTPSNYLPPSDGTPSLPPSPTSPKSLPPSNVQPTPGLPSFNKVFENPDGIYFDERRIGDYGSINDNLRYINLYIDKNYSIGRNIFNYAEKIFPNAVVIVCFVKDGKWKFYLERKKYQDAVRKYLPKSYVNGGSKYIVIDDIPSVERLVKAFEADGKNVVLIYRNIVDDINDVPSTHAALPPSPTTPTNPNAFDTPDWDDIYKRLYDSYHWNSFDPENSANYSIKEFKNLYAYALDKLPEDRKQDFTTKFVNYVYEIARLNAAAPSAAVTGRGGISAKQAAKYNAANDRYMEKRAHFTDWIKNYIDKANRIEEREMKAAMSSEQKFDARFEEIKKRIDYISSLQNLSQAVKKDNKELQRNLLVDFKNNFPNDYARLDASYLSPYHIGLKKKELQSLLSNEASKGNVDLIEKVLAYLKNTAVYTKSNSIWNLADNARKRVAQNQAQEAKFEEQNADETSGYKVEFDTNEDRVKIYFDSIPSEQIRTWLKQHNFRWSPRNSAWQRQITVDSRYVINKFNSLMKDGTLSGLGKPTIKLEFEDNGELMSLFDTDGISGLTVNDKPAAVFNCPESELDCQGFKPTYRRLSDYSHLIDAADGAKTLKGYGFEKSTLEELVNACRQYKQVERLAAHLKDPDKLQSAFNIWHWLHTNVKYNYDTPGQEEIRTPARTWADRERGVDCDCLAVFTACLLINMGYTPAFEIVAFNDSPTYSHIYVNLDGVAIDRVLPIFMARPRKITKTKIMEIPVYELSGVDVGRCNTLNGVYSSTLAKIQSGTATGNDLNDFRKTQVLVTLKGIDEDAYKLAALLMPHIATVGDDGKYYFDNAKFAEIATKADAGLSLLKQQGASKEVLQNWLAEVVSDIDIADTTATATDEDTIVVVINPKGCPCRVAGNFTATELQTLSPMAQTATAQDTPAAVTPSPVYATTPYPTVQPEAEKSNTKWWILGGIAAAFGLVAISKKKNGRR